MTNTSDTIVTGGAGPLGELLAEGKPGWLEITVPGVPTPYYFSDAQDTDSDGVVDDHWAYDPRDDDENGFPDDLMGWFFEHNPELIGFSRLQGNYVIGTNDTRPGLIDSGLDLHGNWVAGVIGAQSDSLGRGIVGIAPEAKILPIRVGRGTSGGDINAKYALSLQYARKLRNNSGNRVVDIVVLAVGEGGAGATVRPEWDCEKFLARDASTNQYLDPFAAQIDSALQEGIVIVNGAGNTNSTVLEKYFTACFEDVVAVAGTRINRREWRDDGSPPAGTTSGPWVDLSAPADGLTSVQPYEVSGQFPCSCTGDLDPVTVGGAQYGWRCGIDGTSLASPIVAGVLALMKSANPALSADQLRAKLLASTDPISSSTQLPGELGTGVVNAYRALTIFGDVATAAADTVWSDEVWISGDIRIPAGKTLAIMPGTVIHVAQDDILGAGQDTTQIEFIVEGSFVAGGTGVDPIVFESFTDADSLWGPFVVDGGAEPPLLAANTEFRDLELDSLIEPNAGDSLHVGALFSIQWTTDHVTSGHVPPKTIVETIDLDLSLDDGQTWSLLQTGIAPGSGSFGWTPKLADVADSVRIRATFRAPMGIGLGVSVSDRFVVPPVTSVVFSNESLEAENQGLTYTGTPYSIVAWDYTGEGREDLFLSQDVQGQLFENTGDVDKDGIPEFFDMTDDVFEVVPAANLRGVSTSDYDGDLDEDLLVTGETGGALYRNDGGTDLVNITASVGLTSALTDSWTGVWQDYDEDGDPDLFVGRAVTTAGAPPHHSNHSSVDRAQPRLLENKSEVFVDVSLERGVVTDSLDAGIACLTAAWADVDGDGDSDLFAGSLIEAHLRQESRLYINPLADGGVNAQDAWTFAEEWRQRIPGDPGDLGLVSGAAWGNLDAGLGDMDLDLALGLRSATHNHPMVLWNDGTGNFTIETLDSDVSATDLKLFDYSLDGVLDILVVPDSTSGASEGPKLFQVVGSGSPVTFVERSVDVGLGDSGGVYGMAIADFDGDQLSDVLLGRKLSSQAFYFRAEDSAAPQQPLFSSASIVLQGSGGNNEAAIGAQVTLKVDGVPQQCAIVDGGSGRGGQGSRRIEFGLGEKTGVLTADILWPDGWLQTAPLYADSTVVVTDQADPSIVLSTVTASYTPEPGGLATWTFQCETEYGSDWRLDQVHVSSPTSCVSGTLTFDASDPNVTCTYYRLANGRFLHKMVVAGMTCTPNCQYSYYWDCSTRFVSSTTSSSPKTFMTKMCVQ